MQELTAHDFLKMCRFSSRRAHELARDADLSPDDPTVFALMTNVLCCGADVKQVDEMVSFCPQIVGCCIKGTSTVKSVSEGLAVTQFPASLSVGSSEI